MKKYILLVLLGASSYGMLSSFAKIAYRQGYIAAEITFSQAIIGALLLWIPAIYRRIKTGKILDHIDWKVLLGGMGMGASAYTYYLSVQYIPASLAIVLLMQMTWISIFIEWIVYKHKPSKIELLITVFILISTILAGNLINISDFQFSLSGIGYGLLSALMYSIYIIATSRLGNDLPMFEKSALMMTGSATMIFIINLKSLIYSSNFDLRLLKWGILLAVFGTVIPPIAFTKGMPKIGASLSSILLTIELPVAVLCAHFILKEPVSYLQIVGIAFMLGAIIYLNIYKRKRVNQLS